MEPRAPAHPAVILVTILTELRNCFFLSSVAAFLNSSVFLPKPLRCSYILAVQTNAQTNTRGGGTCYTSTHLVRKP